MQARHGGSGASVLQSAPPPPAARRRGAAPAVRAAPTPSEGSAIDGAELLQIGGRRRHLELGTGRRLLRAFLQLRL